MSSSKEKFVSKLTELAIVQISEEMGNDGGIRQSCLLTLSEVVQRFIQEIGRKASEYTFASGRTQSNFFDIQQALEKTVGYTVKDLNWFETNSDPLPSIIIPFNSNFDQERNSKGIGDKKNILHEELHMRLQNYWNNDLCNGTVILETNHNISDILSTVVDSNSKMGDSPKNKKNANERNANHRAMKGKHIPKYCPDFPNQHLLKSSSVYYKNEQSNEKQRKNMSENENEDKNELESIFMNDEFSKTRKILIENSHLFMKNMANSGQMLNVDGHFDQPSLKKRRLLNSTVTITDNNNIDDRNENDMKYDNNEDVVLNPWA